MNPCPPQVFVADEGNNAVRTIAFATGVTTTLAGQGSSAELGNGFADGTGTNALFNGPCGVAVDSGTLFISDMFNHAIRAIALDTSVVTTLAGSGSSGFDDGWGEFGASFNKPSGLVLSTDSSILYVADHMNHAIREIEVASTAVTTSQAVEASAMVGM